ncbi:MAG: hypothetical protein ACRC2V_19325 [Xenococcaceae cyanobacterium]
MKDRDAIVSPNTNNTSPNNPEIFQITLALSLGVALIYLAFLKPGIWGFDGSDMFEVANSLVTKGNFTVPPGSGKLGRDGMYYSIRYPLLPIISTPFVAIGLFVADLLNLPARYVASVCALLVPIILTAITTSLVVLIALRLGSSKQGAYLAALSYAFGSAAIAYAHQFFAEPLLSLLTTLSVYLALGKTYKQHAIASTLAGLAISAKPAGVVIGPVLAVYFFCKKYSWRTVITPIIGTAMGMMLYFGYNYMRFESISKSGQNASRFEISGFVERFVGLILSPGAGGGLLWYCTPVFLVAIGGRKLWKSKPIEALLLFGIFSGYWVLHSFWKFGGWSWGPRFLIPTLPVLFAAIALIDKKWWKLLIILTLIGLFWNAPTLISFYQRYYAEANDGGYLNKALSLWGHPFHAPIFNAWGAAFRQVADAFANNVSDILKNAGTPPDKNHLASSDLLRIVAVWWWILPAAGISVWVGFIFAMLLIITGIWMLRRGWILSSECGVRSSKF